MVDLKHFKKTSINKHATTLTHKDGHKLTITHSALSKQMRAKLDELPLEDHPSQKPSGGKIEPKKMAKGGPVTATDEDIAKIEEARAIEDAADKQASIDKHMTFGGAYDAPQQTSSPSGYGIMPPPQASSASPLLDTPKPASVDEMPADPAVMASMEQPLPAAAPAPAAATPVDPSMHGFAEQRQGVMAEAKALGDQGKADAEIAHAQAEAANAKMHEFESHNAELESERKAFQSDLQNQHIDPKHYINSMGTLGKISTGIGLILGGMGSGVTGGENPALKYLNQQIENDIMAQKSEMGKKENLLSANLKQFGNLKEATEMTRIMQNDILSAKLKESAAKAMDPIAKARALQAAGEIDQKSAAAQSKLAAQRTISSLSSGALKDPAQIQQVIDSLRAEHPDQAKELQERFIPGIGLAKVKPNDKDRDTIIGAQGARKALTELQALATLGTTVPGSEQDAINKTKAAALKLQLKTSYQLGVLSQSDLDMLDKLVADPGAIRTGKAIKQLEATKQSMNAIENGVKTKLGIQNSGSDIRTMNGVQYQKVDGGWKKVK